MKIRLEALEAKQEEKPPVVQLIELAASWKEAAINHEWKRAASIREVAQSIFDEYPEWIDRSNTDLTLTKGLYLNWRYFVGYLDNDIQKKYNQAIKDGINPGFALINC